MMPNFNEKDRRIFFSLLAISAVYIFPLILTGRLYVDDLSRSLYGNAGWVTDGRPLATLVMEILNLGKPILNLSPMIQIMSVMILSLSLTLYAKENLRDKEEGMVILCLFSLIANPFFIENLSYKYDSLPMSLSIAAILSPFSINAAGTKWINNIVSVFFVITSLCFYQSSIGLFVIFSLIQCCLLVIGTKINIGELVFVLANRILQLIISYVIYKKFIADKLVGGSYALSHAGIVKISLDSAVIIKRNIKGVCEYLIILLKSYPEILIIFLAIAAVIGVFNLLILSWKKNRNCFAIAFIFPIPFLIVVFSFLHLVVLKNPVFAPRVFTSFGGVLFFLSLCILLLKISIKIKYSIMVPFVFTSFVFMYSYSSVSQAQDKIDTLIASSIYNGINNNKVKGNKVSIYGRVPISSELALASKKIPLLDKLVPIYISNWWWGAVFLQHFRIPVWIDDFTEKDADSICHLKPISDTNDFKIFNADDKIIIVFPDYSCRKLPS